MTAESTTNNNNSSGKNGQKVEMKQKLVELKIKIEKEKGKTISEIKTRCQRTHKRTEITENMIRNIDDRNFIENPEI